MGMSKRRVIYPTRQNIGYFHGWSDYQFAVWLAGFFDGEGCVYLPKGPGIAVSLASTNRDVIESLYRRLPLGQLEEVTFDRAEWSTKYSWRVRRYEDARTVLLMIRPYLTIKTLAADRAISRIADYAERRSATVARHERVIELGEAGLTHTEIAAKVGLGRSAVTVILSRAEQRKAAGPEAVGQPLFTRHPWKRRRERAKAHQVAPRSRTKRLD